MTEDPQVAKVAGTGSRVKDSADASADSTDVMKTVKPKWGSLRAARGRRHRVVEDSGSEEQAPPGASGQSTSDDVRCGEPASSSTQGSNLVADSAAESSVSSASADSTDSLQDYKNVRAISRRRVKPSRPAQRRKLRQRNRGPVNMAWLKSFCQQECGLEPHDSARICDKFINSPRARGQFKSMAKRFFEKFVDDSLSKEDVKQSKRHQETLQSKRGLDVSECKRGRKVLRRISSNGTLELGNAPVHLDTVAPGQHVLSVWELASLVVQNLGDRKSVV